MPELPEVEVVRAGLHPAVAGARVLGVEVFDARALTRHDVAVPGTDPVADFEARLRGREVSGTARRGKFLWLRLGGAPAGDKGIARTSRGEREAILVHLGMSGQMLLRAPGAPAERHERIRIAIDHPEHGELAVVFADQRTFGSLAIDALEPTPDGAAGGHGDVVALVPAQAAHIARDPLDPAFDDRAFLSRLTRSSSAIKRLLLDQTTVSGIGNIYADEALWAARVHPETPAGALSTRTARRLIGETRTVMNRALAEGGTSFDAQYVNVNGQSGYFSRSLSVYGLAGHPCSRCGTPIVREKFMNRSSHFCGVCQRKR